MVSLVSTGRQSGTNVSIGMNCIKWNFEQIGGNVRKLSLKGRKEPVMRNGSKEEAKGMWFIVPPGINRNSMIQVKRYAVHHFTTNSYNAVHLLFIGF